MKMEFNGKKLKALIVQKAMSTGKRNSEIRVDLIKFVGVTKQSLSYWEHGKFMPRMNQLMNLTKYFNLSTVTELIKNEVAK